MQITTTDMKQIAKIWAAVGEKGTAPEKLTITVAKADSAKACACGCGGMTGGGTWLPGHDAKRKATLYALLRDAETPEEAKADAADELAERGWPTPAAKAKKAKAEQVAAEGETENADADAEAEPVAS